MIYNFWCTQLLIFCMHILQCQCLRAKCLIWILQSCQNILSLKVPTLCLLFVCSDFWPDARTLFSLYVYWCRHIVCFVFDCNMCGPDSDIRHKSCDLWWQRIENTEHRHCPIFSNRPQLIILKQMLLCRTVFMRVMFFYYFP